MIGEKFQLISIEKLLQVKFFIPRYQRGYRWGKQQVEDLLNDINEIGTNVSYCLQPLVVAGRKDYVMGPIKALRNGNYEIPENEAKLISGSYEVIDGQQRLTTIYIILKYLNQQSIYEIEYETRSNSQSFLNNIPNDTHENEDNIDYFHMSQCYDTVSKWFDSKDVNFNKSAFKDKLLRQVNFIWYQDESGKAVETFTRLNLGKIPLTNAELIKAMLLKQSNFNINNGQDIEEFRLSQLEMAAQWDEIEFTLQNDEFWYFIHPQEWKPTRIDLVFDLMKELNSLDFVGENLGNDNYTTFRYFYQYLKEDDLKRKSEKYKNIWKKVREIFQIFCEWFNDITFYHYIGFLTNCGEQLILNHSKDKRKNNEIEDYQLCPIELWYKYKTKEVFEKKLKGKIENKIKALNLTNLKTTFQDKKQWRPLLLLFNIQSVIDQNAEYADKYGKGIFYKFPFYLYQKEKWDIEHIDAATTNELTQNKDQKEWLKNIYLGMKEKIDKSDGLIEKIVNFLKNNCNQDNNFHDLSNAIIELIPENNNHIEEKDSIGNFVLLDANTNRGYGNEIYPTKRRKIIGKDQGMNYDIVVGENNQLEINIIEGKNISFIPPCTRNVFMKYYTPNSTDIMIWTQEDASAYMKNIYETLKDFGVSNPENNDNVKGQN